MNEPQASLSHPSHDEFAALLEETLSGSALQEGSVIKGTVVAIEKDVAVIDVGLKTEGRVSLQGIRLAGPPGGSRHWRRGRRLSRAGRECSGRSRAVAREGAP